MCVKLLKTQTQSLSHANGPESKLLKKMFRNYLVKIPNVIKYV